MVDNLSALRGLTDAAGEHRDGLLMTSNGHIIDLMDACYHCAIADANRPGRPGAHRHLTWNLEPKSGRGGFLRSALPCGFRER